MANLESKLSKRVQGRRFGKPRSDEERKKRHKFLFGNEKLPPRGTGLARGK